MAYVDPSWQASSRAAWACCGSSAIRCQPTGWRSGRCSRGSMR